MYKLIFYYLKKITGNISLGAQDKHPSAIFSSASKVWNSPFWPMQEFKCTEVDQIQLNDAWQAELRFEWQFVMIETTGQHFTGMRIMQSLPTMNGEINSGIVPSEIELQNHTPEVLVVAESQWMLIPIITFKIFKYQEFDFPANFHHLLSETQYQPWYWKI